MVLLGCSESSTDVPKILIIGDSISSGYFPLVQKNLIGKAKVYQPTYSEKNGKIKANRCQTYFCYNNSLS